jgi:1-acyl-sn-glycerol-3-phosphate acyltransferase
MIKAFSRFLLLRVLGFTVNVKEPIPPKFIIALAPHTSNWDFVIGNLYSRAMDIPCQFLMKKEWFIWPLGYIMKSLGGIPIDRSKRTRVTEQIAQTAREQEVFHLCITPEGTRKRNPEWKKGFYYIALMADIPILLYGLDYRRRLIECTKTIVPSGDIEKDMAEIKSYFKNYNGKHPEKFAL